MAVATPHAEPSAALVGDKGLKRDAIGYLSNLVIGVASTAPAYSLAATLGFIVAVPGMGLHAPAVLLVSFIPILLIAFGYKFLNRADPDCGTTFAWATRAMGPYIGWINGWAIFVADVIVMASLSVIASTYTYLLFGWSGGANSTFWIVAIVKVYANAPANSVRISADWFNPFALGFKPLVDGILLGIFIYWGWDSGVAVNEETESSAEAPGRAAVLSTLILLAIYLVVSAAAQSYGGTGLLINNSNDVLRVLGTHVFGSPWDKLLIIAVLTSASASTQTTILPTARTTLSMARWKSIPGIFGHIHPKYLTPDVSTLGMGGLSIVFTVLLVGFNSSQDVLGDSITALGFAILFYYGFTGLACAVYFRKELVKSWRHFLAAGVVPLAGFGLMAAIFVKAFHDYSQTGAGYAKPLFGIQIPIVIGIGSLLLGIPLMLLCALKFREFFSRKPELAPDGSLDYVPEEVSIHF
jgi:amino acid transporter